MNDNLKNFKIYIDEIKSFPHVFEKTTFIEEQNMPEEVYLKVVVDMTAGKDYIVKGVIKTKLSLECVKCLCDVCENLDLKFTVLFTRKNISKQLSQDELQSDLYEIKDDCIDVLSVVIDTINSSLPMKIMCDDDCKGLCLLCGTNLNKETCSCHEKLEELKIINEKPKNSAFADLKSLIKFDEVD